MPKPLFSHVLNLRNPVTSTTVSPPSGPAGGDLAGTYPNPTVAHVDWSTLTTGTIAAGGDLAGSTYPNPLLTAAAKSKWQVVGSTLTPLGSFANLVTLDTSGNLSLPTLACRTNIGRASIYTVNGDVSKLFSFNDSGNPNYIASKASWQMELVGEVGSADAVLFKRAPQASSVYTQMFTFDVNGNVIIAGPTGQKSAGTTWANPSDPRLKTDMAPYPRGLADVLQLDPITYRLKASPDALCIGFDAAQVQPVFPECVSETSMKLDPADAEPTDGVLSFDMHPILVAMVTAVKELAAQVAELTARVVALEGKP